MSQIFYPKPLPSLIKEAVTHESGFTPTEVAALQNGWRLFKRRFNFHASKISMGYFNENYIFLEKFRHKDTGKFNLTSLHHHSKQMLNIYGSLIDSGLNNMAFINVLMSDVSYRHKMYGVSQSDIKTYTDHIALYIIEYLSKINSPTFVRGLNKLNDLINAHHLEKHEGKDSDSCNQSEASIMH